MRRVGLRVWKSQSHEQGCEPRHPENSVPLQNSAHRIASRFLSFQLSPLSPSSDQWLGVDAFIARSTLQLAPIATNMVDLAPNNVLKHICIYIERAYLPHSSSFADNLYLQTKCLLYHRISIWLLGFHTIAGTIREMYNPKDRTAFRLCKLVSETFGAGVVIHAFHVRILMEAEGSCHRHNDFSLRRSHGEASSAQERQAIHARISTYARLSLA